MPTTENLSSWADSNGMTSVPALGIPADDQDELTDVSYQWEGDMYIPTSAFIGPDMTILAMDDGTTDPSRYMP